MKKILTIMCNGTCTRNWQRYDSGGEEGDDTSKRNERSSLVTTNNYNNFDDTWFFPGWMAFKCFGPMAPPSYQCVVFELGGSKCVNKKESGRGHAQKQQKKEDYTIQEISKMAAAIQEEV